MRNKFHKRFFFVNVFLTALLAPSFALAQEDSAFAHKLLGNCFKSVEAFIEAQFGKTGVTDENIKVSSGKFAGKQVDWVVDQTASKHYQWFLLDVPEPGRHCLRLYVPSAGLVEPVRGGGREFPVRFRSSISPEPGSPEKIAILKFVPKEGIYKPELCKVVETDSQGRMKSTKQIHCGKWLN